MPGDACGTLETGDTFPGTFLLQSIGLIVQWPQPGQKGVAFRRLGKDVRAQ